MRIAIVRREPKVAFSMDIYADNLVRELKKIRPNWEIIEIAPKPWSEDLENLWKSGNPLRKYYERFINHPRAVSQLNVDLFHIIDHTNAHVAYWLRKLEKPIIITCHDLVQYVYPEILRNQSRFPALSMKVWQHSVEGINVANRAVTVSENTAKDIVDWLNFNPKQITVIPNGVESKFKQLPAAIVDDWRSRYTNFPEEVCLLNVGSSHQRKNILTILKVLKEMIAQAVPVRLWKVGGDFTSEQKQFINEFELSKNITFISKSTQADLIKFYNAADILLSPSLYEGFGLTIIEAMACGTPVITSDVSSLPEVAGDAAISVSPLDTGAIVAAIVKIQKNASYRRSLITKGLHRASLFTWKAAAMKMAEVYQAEVSLGK